MEHVGRKKKSPPKNVSIHDLELKLQDMTKYINDISNKSVSRTRGSQKQSPDKKFVELKQTEESQHHINFVLTQNSNQNFIKNLRPQPAPGGPNDPGDTYKLTNSSQNSDVLLLKKYFQASNNPNLLSHNLESQAIDHKYLQELRTSKKHKFQNSFGNVLQQSKVDAKEEMNGHNFTVMSEKQAEADYVAHVKQYEDQLHRIGGNHRSKCGSMGVDASSFQN